MKVKVIYILPSLEIGGAEKQVVETALRIDRSRFRPQVICISGGGPLETLLSAGEVPVTVFNFKVLARNVPRNLFQYHKLIEFLRKENPHIIHTYLFWSTFYGVLAANRAKVPVIITSRREISYHRGKKFYLTCMEKSANRKTDCVTVNSEAVFKDVMRREGIDENKLKVIYNGCDYKLYNSGKHQEHHRTSIRKEFGIRKDEVVIGIIANHYQNKGHEYLIKALHRVNKKHDNVSLLLVGKDMGYGEVLKKLVMDLGLSGKVIFTGLRDDIPRLLHAVDLGVCASVFSEGFSNAILEMMAAGLPVIATNVGGNPEAVVDGETGFIVPPEDSDAIAERALELIDNPELAARLGAAGRKRVKQTFSMEKMIDNMENLYMELLEKKLNAHIL